MIPIFVLKELTLIFIYINKGKLHQNNINNENEIASFLIIISQFLTICSIVYNGKTPKLFKQKISVFDNFFPILLNISRKQISHSCAGLH